MSFWKGKKVLITGGAGFIGSHLVEEILRREKNVSVTVADLCAKPSNLRAVIKDVRYMKLDLFSLDNCLKACRGQDVVFNLAAHVGGVGYNAEHPGTMFRDNTELFSNILEAARRREVERFLVVSSACVYPRYCTIPTPETEGFKDWPEDTNEGYGWSK